MELHFIYKYPLELFFFFRFLGRRIEEKERRAGRWTGGPPAGWPSNFSGGQICTGRDTWPLFLSSYYVYTVYIYIRARERYPLTRFLLFYLFLNMIFLF